MRQIVMIAVFLIFASAAQAKTIVNDRGGEIIEYALRAAKLVKSGERVRFQGACDSACTLYLRIPNACVGPQASFGFHLPKPNTATARKYLWDSYPGWVRSWITVNGGLTADIKVMPRKDIKLPTCK